MLPVVGASSRFLITIVTGVRLLNERDVNCLPDRYGEIIESILISLLEAGFVQFHCLASEKLLSPCDLDY